MPSVICFPNEAKLILKVGINFIMPGWETMTNYDWNWDDWWTAVWYRGMILCFSQSSQMKATVLMSPVLSQGRVAVACCLLQRWACSQSYHALFPPLMDGRLQTLKGLEWKPTLAWHFCLVPTGTTKELNISDLLQLNNSFQGEAPNVCVFQTQTPWCFLLAGICSNAQKLSSFAEWLDFKCIFLGCW